MSCSFLLSARSIYSDVNEQFDENDFDRNDQRREWHYPRLYPNKFFNWKAKELVQPYDQDRIQIETRRAKAIIKGDPREFMG